MVAQLTSITLNGQAQADLNGKLFPAPRLSCMSASVVDIVLVVDMQGVPSRPQLRLVADESLGRLGKNTALTNRNSTIEDACSGIGSLRRDGISCHQQVALACLAG
jgi:hypothetical protein